MTAQQLAELLGPLARAAALIPTMHEFNVGESKHDFRVPDGGLRRRQPRGTWQPTAALVVEIASPGDESWQKLPFYATHNVDEVVIVDPVERSVAWLALDVGEYQRVSRSGLIDLGAAQVEGKLDWPDGGTPDQPPTEAGAPADRRAGRPGSHMCATVSCDRRGVGTWR